MNTDQGQHLFHVDFMVARIRRVAAGRIGHHRYRITQVVLQRFFSRHVFRHFAEYVVVVPRINKAHLFAAAAQGAHNQIDRYDFTEVSDVNRSRRRNARSAGVRIQIAALADYFFRTLIRPVNQFSRGGPMFICVTHKRKYNKKVKGIQHN